MSFFTHLEYAYGGERFSGDRPRNNLGSDGDVLEARYDLERVRRELEPDTISRGPASLWRYAPLLPAERPHEAVSLGEGWTPLLPARSLANHLGMDTVLVKDEGRNPSGTFKDRGASVAVTRLRELGVEHVIHHSSGNAGAAWAMYCARAGLGCTNLLPDDVLPASERQCALAGAQSYIVNAPWSRAGAMVRGAAAANGWFECATLREPYRMEGKKTMGYEICEQLGWELPDVVVYPTGGALGAIAIFKAFRELESLGWVKGTARPRLLVTQYEGCAPIVDAFARGLDRAEPWTALDVLPGGLKGVSPPGDRAVLDILRKSAGGAVAVGNSAALAAVETLARLEGVFACPESATVVAGLAQALADVIVDPGERAVLMITGTGLKSIPVLPAPPRRLVASPCDIAGN